MASFFAKGWHVNRPRPSDVGLPFISVVTRDGLTHSLRDHVSFSCGLYHISYTVSGWFEGEMRHSVPASVFFRSRRSNGVILVYWVVSVGGIMGVGLGDFSRASAGACIRIVRGRGSRMRRSIWATGPMKK